MDRFRSLRERRRLSARLVAGFATLILAILLLGINSILAARDMSRQSTELYQMELLGISRIREANIDLISTGRTLGQMVLAPTFVDRDEAKAQLDQTMLELEQQIVAVRQSIFREQESLLLNEFEMEFELYKSNVNDAITLIARSTDYQQKATAYISGEPFNQVADSADQLLHRMVAIKEEGARKTAVAIARHGRYAQWLTSGLLLAGLLCGTIVAVLIGRSINQPANRLYNATDNQATENVDDKIPLIDERNKLVAEEPSVAMTARQAELNQAEACKVVENISGDVLAADDRDAPIWRASILIVEDDESSGEVTASLRANADCRVAIAHSGQEALDLLRKSPYDVILMNMQMMTDGINATLEIRKSTASDSLPIIAVTARGIHQDSERCLAAGMNGHIAKPIGPDELFRALMHWISADAQNAVDRQDIVDK